METSVRLAMELMASRHHYIPISLGTTSTKLLCQRFLTALENYHNSWDKEAESLIHQIYQTVPYEAWNHVSHPYWTTREAEDLVHDTLSNALNQLVPFGFYFGTSLNYPYDYHFGWQDDNSDAREDVLEEDPHARHNRWQDAIAHDGDVYYTPSRLLEEHEYLLAQKEGR